MLRYAITAALLASASGAALASDLIPLRPALEDAQVLLYDGQTTPFGEVDVLPSSVFSLGRDGAMYANVNLDRAESGVVSAIVRFAGGSTTPELVIASGGTTTTGETIVAVGAFALLPSAGPIAITAEIRAPGESANRSAILRVDAPDSATVLLRQGDPAPPPLTGAFGDFPLFRPFNALSDTHMSGSTFFEIDEFTSYGAIVRLSIDGDVEVLAATGVDQVERLDLYPRVGPSNDVVFATSPTALIPQDQRVVSELRRVDANGAQTALIATGDPVSGTPRPSLVQILRVTLEDPPSLPDAHHIGPDGEIYVASFLETDLAASQSPNALLRVDDSGAHAILLDTDVDPRGAASIAPAIRAFREGAVVAVLFRDAQRPRELWYTDGVDRRRLLTDGDSAPGFVDGSVLRPSIVQFGPSHYDLDRDRIVFTSIVDEPGAKQTPAGVFTLSEFGAVDLLVRTGDSALVDASARVVRSLGQPPNGIYKTDDSSGQVLLGAQLDNDSSAILRLQRVVSNDAASSHCAGDLTRDNRVDVADLHAALASSPINFADLNLVLSAFGSTCD